MNGIPRYSRRLRTVLFIWILVGVTTAYPVAVYPDHHVQVHIVVKPSRQTKTLTMVVTAYASTDADCGKHDGITATGSKAGSGTVAADWQVLSPGTRLEIPGYGQGVVADRGGGIRGNKLDVWMPDRNQCFKWGKKKLEVRVIQ